MKLLHLSEVRACDVDTIYDYIYMDFKGSYNENNVIIKKYEYIAKKILK